MKSKSIIINNSIQTVVVALAVMQLNNVIIAEEFHRRGDHRNILERMDINSDGVISRNEFRGPEGRFSKLDKNGDGLLTSEEIQKRKTRLGKRSRPNPEQLLERFDDNDDRLLSLGEFMGPEDHFEMLDKNTDGFLSIEELKAGPPHGRGGGRTPDCQ